MSDINQIVNIIKEEITHSEPSKTRIITHFQKNSVVSSKFFFKFFLFIWS
ncbi:hypothetical protein ES703_37754 [subsurface metagenome]